MEHIDKQTFKQIFRDRWEAFMAANPRYATTYYDTIVHKMLDCGDPDKMGFAQFRCLYCGEIRRIAFSCKCSFCLSCAKPHTDRWVEFISRRLLPGVTYRHFVFTMPDFLRLWFYRNPKLLSPLMRAGHACLRDIFASCAKTPLDIGSIIVLQTAGRPATYNPHLHMLVTQGGLNPKGEWVSLSYIPYDLIHRKWQYRLLTMLRQEVDDPAIEKDIDRAWRDYPKGFVAFLQDGDVPSGGRGLAQYLAKYVVSPPISVRRIERYDGRTVRYWYRDHKTGQIEHETLPALRFLGRMVQHILPKGFQRIRYYGFHGNVRYAKMRQAVAKAVPSDAPSSPLGYRVIPRKPFARLFQDTFGENPLLCPRCREEMTLELLHHPRYGIIRDYRDTFFAEAPREQPPPAPPTPGRRRPLDRSERMVQVPLPFV